MEGRERAMTADKLEQEPAAAGTTATDSDNGLGPTGTIRYDPGLLRQEFLALLEGLTVDMQTDAVRRVVGTRLVRQVREAEARIRSRFATDFTVVVLGDFKRGKSTLINALMATPVVTMNVTPETVTINELRYGPELSIEACLVDGRRVTLQPDELPHDRLLPVMQQLPQPVSHLRIKAPVEWLRGICLVDTPGIGDLLRQVDRLVQDYLSQADMVVCVVSALAPLAESEQTYLRLSLVPQEFPKVFFIVNMMDFALKEADAGRLLEHIRAKLNRLFPDAQVFGVSALDELARQSGGTRPNPGRAATLESAFAAFRQRLDEALLLDRELIQLDRATNQMEDLVDQGRARVTLLRDSMHADQAELSQAIADAEDENSTVNQRISQHKAAVQADLDTMRAQAIQWMTEYVDRLHGAALATLDSASFDDIQLHLQFFLADSLRVGISQCLLAHESATLESINRGRVVVTDGVSQLVGPQPGSDAVAGSVAEATFAKPSYSTPLTINTAVGFLDMSITGGLLSGVTKLLIRQAEDAASSSNYRAMLMAALPELRASVRQAVQSLYDHLAQETEQRLADAYQQELESAVVAMRQAREVGAEGERNVAAARVTLQEVLHLLEDTKLRLDTLRQKLWSDATLESMRDGRTRLGGEC